MKFNFPNDAGEVLSGRLEMPESNNPKAFALFAHCFTCSKNVNAASAVSKALTGNGIAVLRFDFTGLGNSEGDFANTNFSSNVRDLVIACDEIEKKYKKAPKLLIGHSLGGAAVLKAATYLNKVVAIATIGAPSSVEHVSHLFNSHIDQINENGEAEVTLYGRKFKIKKQFIDDINDTEILKEVSDLKKALLIMHSPTDDTVSIDHAAEIFIAAKHPKSFISLDGTNHLLMNKEDGEYVAKVIGAWSERYL